MTEEPTRVSDGGTGESVPVGPWVPPATAPEYVQPVAPVRAGGGGSRRLLAAGGLVLLLLGALVASAAAMSGPGTNDQATAGGQAAPSSSPAVVAAASPVPGASASPDARTEACQTYLENLATRLNVSVSTLEQALVGAAGDTIDQMVKDGRLTADQGAYLKGQLSAADGSCAAGPGHMGKGWFGGMMMPFAPGMDGFDGDRGEMHGAGAGVPVDTTAILDTAATALKIDRQTLLTELGALKGGEDLKTIAQKHSVAYDTLSAAIRAEVKSQLDAAVTKGTITADQETAALQRVDARLADGGLPWGAGPLGGRGGRGGGHMGGGWGDNDENGPVPGSSPTPTPAPGA